MGVVFKVIYLFMCDSCFDTIEVVTHDYPVPKLEAPWREVDLPGYVGRYHACSAKCELLLRSRRKG